MITMVARLKCLAFRDPIVLRVSCTGQCLEIPPAFAFNYFLLASSISADIASSASSAGTKTWSW